MTSLLLLLTPLIGCYTYRVVFFHFAIFMDRFLKRAAPSTLVLVAALPGPLVSAADNDC